MKRFKLVALALAVALGTFGLATRRSAQAATATSNFTVTATVISSCTIATTGITFGNYDPVVANTTTPLDANGSVTVACTAGAATTIGMGQGTNLDPTSTAGIPVRRMVSGANHVRYDLYQDATRATIWGDVGTTAAMTYNSVSFAAQTFPIYGRMPAAQDVQTGAYTDTVTATIQF
jgi:spore coat protein U-like protein